MELEHNEIYVYNMQLNQKRSSCIKFIPAVSIDDSWAYTSIFWSDSVSNADVGVGARTIDTWTGT